MLRRMARSQEGGQRREARAKPEAGQGAEVRLEGFEPPTNGLEGRRSSSELQAPERRVAAYPTNSACASGLAACQSLR